MCIVLVLGLGDVTGTVFFFTLAALLCNTKFASSQV